VLVAAGCQHKQTMRTHARTLTCTHARTLTRTHARTHASMHTTHTLHSPTHTHAGLIVCALGNGEDEQDEIAPDEFPMVSQPLSQIVVFMTNVKEIRTAPSKDAIMIHDTWFAIRKQYVRKPLPQIVFFSSKCEEIIRMALKRSNFDPTSTVRSMRRT
jgi:hypothetical protein